MTSDETRRCRAVSALLSVWLLGVTAAAIMAYVQSSRCADCKPCPQDGDGAQFQQQSNSSTDEPRALIMNDLLKCLADRLDVGSDVRVRRSLPTNLSSASSPTLLFSLLDSLIQDSLSKVCRPSDKVCLPGPEGRKGEQGHPGWPGYRGEKGLPGELGKQGVAGKLGAKGVQGMTGVKGDVGVGGQKGDTGTKGERGVKGVKGIAGEKGSMGDKGELGSTGSKGEKGMTGTIGLRGVKGENGSAGEKGQKGEKGVEFQFPRSMLPPECSNYHLLDEPWRKVSVENWGLNELTYKCDSSWSTEGWKRFAESIGGRMPESCPPSSHRCGAEAPGWLAGYHPEAPGLYAGSHPTTVGNKSSALVCFRNFGYCCFDYVSVQVSNCGLYYVYNLPYPNNCNYVYCGNA